MESSRHRFAGGSPSIICGWCGMPTSAALGIAMLPEMVAKPHLAEGSLAHLLPDFTGSLRTKTRLVYPGGGHLSPAVRAFLDFAKSQFQSILEQFDAGLGRVMNVLSISTVSVVTSHLNLIVWLMGHYSSNQSEFQNTQRMETDMTKRNVLVTASDGCQSGRIGGPGLGRQGLRVIRCVGSIQGLRWGFAGFGAWSWRRGDYDDAASLAAALDGIVTLFAANHAVRPVGWRLKSAKARRLRTRP